MRSTIKGNRPIINGPHRFTTLARSAASIPLLWLGFSLAHVAVTLPWMLYFLEGARARRPVAAAIGVALSTAAAVLGGHPETSFYVGAAAFVWIMEGLHYVRLHRMVGGAALPLRYAWMAWMPYPTTIPIGLSMLLRPELDWRGHKYRLDGAARLRSAESRVDEVTPRPGPPS